MCGRERVAQILIWIGNQNDVAGMFTMSTPHGGIPSIYAGLQPINLAGLCSAAAELYPSEGGSTTFPYVTVEWARQWPTEEVWVARRTG